MSLTTNTSNLQLILNSDMGGPPATCTLVVNRDIWDSSYNYCAITCVENDNITTKTQTGISARIIIHAPWEQTFTDVLCGGLFIFSNSAYSDETFTFTLTNATLLGSYSGTYWFMITAGKGEEARIEW